MASPNNFRDSELPNCMSNSQYNEAELIIPDDTKIQTLENQSINHITDSSYGTFTNQSVELSPEIKKPCDRQLTMVTIVILVFTLALNISSIVIGQRESKCDNTEQFSVWAFVTGIIGVTLVGIYFICFVLYEFSKSEIFKTSFCVKSDIHIVLFRIINATFFIITPIFLGVTIIPGIIIFSNFFHPCDTIDYDYAVSTLMFILFRSANFLISLVLVDREVILPNYF